MIIVCQQCGQKLPKTAIMCPNCGSRHFAPDENVQTSSQLSQPTSQNTITQPYFDNAQPTNTTDLTGSTWQNYTANTNTDNIGQSSMPQTNPQQPAYYNYEQPLNIQSTNPYQAQQTYQSHPVAEYNQPNTYAPEPVQSVNQYTNSISNQLPSTALQTRKPAYTMLYAGFIRRAFAYLFDLAFVSLILGLAYQLLLPQILPKLGIRGFSDQSLALIAYGFYLFYMTLLTCLGRQATVGKVIMGMWVFGMQGQRVNFFHALIRETLKLILLPFSFLMWFTARKQTLHDLIARTVVLYDPN